MRSWALVVAASTMVAAACDGSGASETSRQAEVYAAAIRDVLADDPPPDDDELPVVYVLAAGETDIAADVQAEVASELKEDADVRFADERSEAVLDDEDGVPVRDAGVLLAVGPIAATQVEAELALEVYRSERERSNWVFTIERRSSQWTVTSSVELDA